MAYRVSAIAGIGTAISVIVKTTEQAIEKLDEYREDGFKERLVKDMDGRLIDLEQLSKSAE